MIAKSTRWRGGHSKRFRGGDACVSRTVDEERKRRSEAETSEEAQRSLPTFDNLSDDKEMQFFSDGRFGGKGGNLQFLTRSAGMSVIGRNSSFQFRGETQREEVKRGTTLGATIFFFFFFPLTARYGQGRRHA